MHDLTLLIQLFGREVMDGLLQCGFDTNDAIARAGPELLSEEAEIPLPLARRIVAVAMESQALDEQAPQAPAAEGPPPTTKKPARAKRTAPAADPAQAQDHVRRPLRRPHSQLTASRATEAEAEEKNERESDEATDETIEALDEAPPRQLDRHPIVDDVGLVSWMGFSSRASGSRMISVADTILDPREPHTDEDPPQAASPQARPAATPPPATTPPSTARQASPTPVATPVTATRPIDAAPAARPLGSVPATRESRLVGGSFWSFGTVRRQTDAVTEARRGSPMAEKDLAPGGAAPRRRSSDGT